MATAATKEYRFDLGGGHLSLDFLNSLSERYSGPIERLNTYADLISFARQASALDPAVAGRLLSEAERHPTLAGRALGRALHFREALYRLFVALTDGESPRSEDLDTVNGVVANALSHAKLEQGEVGFDWTWGEESRALDRPLWSIARSTAELLTSDDLSRVHFCSSDSCLWLFLDTSRNRSRRWCDMKGCGNREKAKRHYRRVRAHETS